MTSTIKYPLRDGEQLIYLHIPKTAGTTFGAVLDAIFHPEERLAFYRVHLRDCGRGEFDAFRCIRGHFERSLIAPFLTRPAVYISFLRDPIECALSHYGHIQQWPPVPKYAVGKGLGLEEFLYDPQAYHRISNLQTRWLASSMYFDPLLDWSEAVWQAKRYEEAEAIAGKSPPATRAMRVLDAMPFFGLAERFDDSLALFTYTFGFAPIRQVKHLNAARRPRPQRAQVALRLLERLRELNQEDAALYAYAQRLFAARYTRMLYELLEDNQRQFGSEPVVHSDAIVSVSAIPAPEDMP